VAQAQVEHKFLFKAETQIPFMVSPTLTLTLMQIPFMVSPTLTLTLMQIPFMVSPTLTLTLMQIPFMVSPGTGPSPSPES
jgi:hypothetical protein